MFGIEDLNIDAGGNPLAGLAMTGSGEDSDFMAAQNPLPGKSKRHELQTAGMKIRERDQNVQARHGNFCAQPRADLQEKNRRGAANRYLDQFFS